MWAVVVKPKDENLFNEISKYNRLLQLLIVPSRILHDLNLAYYYIAAMVGLGIDSPVMLYTQKLDGALRDLFGYGLQLFSEILSERAN